MARDDLDVRVRTVLPPSAVQLAAARATVAAHLRPTPLLESPGLGPGGLLKLEAAQPTGSFKVRGALAALSALAPETPVVTVSTGNHAQATAWAAQRLGRRATIVVPETASPAKLAGLARFDSPVERVGAGYDEAEAHAMELATAGHHYLSPYNDALVIAGQSTVGMELEALDGPITLVVPVGGGGLLAGIALWARGRPHVRLVGVEAEVSRAVSVALDAGRVVEVEVGPTLADGMAGNVEAGSVTVGIIGERVDAMVAVGEDEIVAAMRFLDREHGLVAEGAGAVATAALLAGRVDVPGRPVALVSGRNITDELRAQVLGG